MKFSARKSFTISRWIGLSVLLLSSTAQAGTLTNLGPQVTATSIQGSVFLRDAKGRDVIYTVERGQPGHLLGYDVADGRMVVNLAMPGDCDGAWEITASSDGYVYTSGGNGHMFRYKPGAKTIEDLGDAPPGEKVVWDVAPGKNGEIFGGTYPDCRVVQYKPGMGYSDVCHGPVVAGENYVRAVVYDSVNNKIYAGVGSHAHLIEIDPQTGTKRELLADAARGQEAVYSLQIIPDEKSGDRLLAWITNRNQTLIYNLRTRELERSFSSGPVKAVTKSPANETVYYCDDEHLMAIDLDKPKQPPRALTRCIGMLASRWVDSNRLCVLTRYGQLLTYDIKTGQSQTLALRLPPQPIPIQSLALGPDSQMWMGGFLAGGMTAFNPATGKSREYRGMSQIEAMATLGSQMYLGVYPHGRLYQFDPRETWGRDNPRLLATIPRQSRPIAILGVPELKKVFVGMVPEYGLLGGDLLEFSPAASALKNYGSVIADQSIVSLAYTRHMLLGGTSITGGLGMAPAAREAKLFGWDPKSEKKLFEIVPVKGAVAITCLINGPDGNIWGIADGNLFIFDPAAGKVSGVHRLIAVHYSSPNIWRDAFLIAHPNRQIYGVIDGRFFRLDPEDKQVTILREHGITLLAMDRHGQLYFCEGIDLWRYVP